MLHPTFEPLNRSLTEDWFLLPFEIRLQRAHVAALVAAEVLTDDESSRIKSALDAIEDRYGDETCPESPAEDIHTWIESAVCDFAGDVGRKLHTARSRNDQVATLLQMYLIDAGLDLSRQLSELIGVCRQRAEEWADLTGPMQTHAQFAAPGTMGFWVLRYGIAFDRTRRVVDDAVARWKRSCPLGSGAVAGSSIPIDRRIQAKALGFEAPSLNALDSTSTRDTCLEYLGAASQAALHLQSFAADVIGFSQTPFGWVKYPPAFGTGSSMMPNKSNPDAMELLRGECCGVHGAHIEMMMLMKGLPSGYNRDLQCCKPLVHRTVERMSSICAMTKAFVASMAFDETRLVAATKEGAIGATLAMETAVKSGTAMRDAHHSSASIAEADGFARTVDAYQTVGGSHPDEVRRVARELTG